MLAARTAKKKEKEKENPKTAVQNSSPSVKITFLPGFIFATGCNCLGCNGNKLQEEITFLVSCLNTDLSNMPPVFKLIFKHCLLSNCWTLCGRYLWSVYTHLLVWRLFLSAPLQIAWHKLSASTGLHRSQPKYTSWGHYTCFSIHFHIVNSQVRWWAAGGFSSLAFLEIFGKGTSSHKEHPQPNGWWAVFRLLFTLLMAQELHLQPHVSNPSSPGLCLSAASTVSCRRCCWSRNSVLKRLNSHKGLFGLPPASFRPHIS